MFNDNITIFGNGVCGNRLDSASQFTYGFHITQEHSGLGSDSTIGNLGCKLIVCANAFKGLSIQGNRNAAAWDFNSTGVYDTGTQTNPAIAEVFYGNNSFTMEDIFYSYIAGMDAFALGYRAALKLLEDGRIEKFTADRYSSWKSGIGADIISGKADMAALEKYALEKGEVVSSLSSGRQEMLESIVNNVIFNL